MRKRVRKFLCHHVRPRATLKHGKLTGKRKDTPGATPPEIDNERQKYLAERRCITPDIEHGIYPFKDIKLNRTDIEWLLATHENGRGRVDWNDTSKHARRGLDLRGANLSKVDLSHLPLACMCGGLTGREIVAAPVEQQNMPAVHLEGADLYEAHLEGARLAHGHLEGARLYSVHLDGAKMRFTYFDSTTNLESISLGGRARTRPAAILRCWRGRFLAVHGS